MKRETHDGAVAEGSPYMDAVRGMIRTMRRHHACVERRIGDLGIHHSQHRMLMHLARQKEIPSQKKLAEALGISPAATATTLKRLEREGYITRTITDSDNRKNEIRITEEGFSKVMESREIIENVDRAMFAGFSPEEMAVLNDYIRRINANLDAVGAPADPLCQSTHPASTRKEETT